jgi:hypothetical protein
MLWFCLRQEPVVYVNDMPYCLKYVNKLIENIEIKGIFYNIIQKVEKDMEIDVINEAKNLKLLLHDEIAVNGKQKYIGKSFFVKQIKTLKTSSKNTI